MEEFANIVQEHFRFLVDDHAFQAHVPTESRVQFTNSTVFIQVACSNRGGVGLVVDRNPPRYFFSFDWYLRHFVADPDLRLEDDATWSRLEMEIAVMKLARLFARFGQPIIQGDPELFDSMATKYRELYGAP